jgi:hypothetical protein
MKPRRNTINGMQIVVIIAELRNASSPVPPLCLPEIESSFIDGTPTAFLNPAKNVVDLVNGG